METCRGATCRKRNQAETELFTNFGAETENETEIRSTSRVEFEELLKINGTQLG